MVLEFTPGVSFAFTDAFAAGWVPREPFMVGIFCIFAEGQGTRYRACARHWSAETMKQHEEMGFMEGWGAVANQLKELAEASR